MKFQKQNGANFNLLWTLLLAAFAVCCVALNWFSLYNESFWVDEFMSIDMVRLPVAEMLPATMADVQPPLYYLIVRAFCVALGWSHFAYRLASFVPMILLAVAAVTLLRRAFGVFPAFLLLLFSFFGQQAMNHMAEVRMYGWLLLFMTLFGYAAYRVIESNGESRASWVLLTVMGLLVAYTHYFSLVSVAILYLLLLMALVVRRQKLRSWFLCVAVSAVGYLPWLLPLLGHLGNSVENFALWDPTSWHTTLEQVFGESTFDYCLLALCGVLMAVYLGLGLKKGFDPKHWFVLLAVATPLITITLGEAFSAFVRPIWVGRYVFACLGLVWLAFGLAVRELFAKAPLVGWGAGLVVAGLAVYCCNQYYQPRREFVRECNVQVKESLQYLAERVQPEDYLVTCFGLEVQEDVLEFYFPEQTVVPYEEIDTWLDGQHNVFLFINPKDEVPEEVQARMAEYGMFEDEYHSMRLAAVYPVMHQLRLPQP